MVWYIIGLIGCTIFWDGVASWTLYLNQPDYQGKKQTFRKDHWVRLVRICCALTLIIIAGINI